jgi:hypothetical protein
MERQITTNTELTIVETLAKEATHRHRRRQKIPPELRQE